jgi:hypothetical protein
MAKESEAESSKSDDKGVQLNVFIPNSLMKRLRAYANSSLYQPSLGRIVTAAITEHLDSREGVQPSVPRPRKPR